MTRPSVHRSMLPTGAPQTGISTPRYSASFRPLVLSHGSLEYTIPVPTNLHFAASQLKSQFEASLPAPTDELAQDDEPSSVPELVARFLGFVSREIDEDTDMQDLGEDVLRTLVLEFERAFLNANDVHALAASLPGIELKKRIVVQCYIAARASVKRPMSRWESALLRAAHDGEATLYTIFGGQGNIEEYFDELRDVYTTYPSFVGDLVEESAKLLQKLSNDPRINKLYSKGLDVMQWLRSIDSQPDTEYLVSAPVSLPLIGLVQLAHYTVACKALGLEPDDIRERLAGTTGHSQGIVTAAVLATVTTWESFEQAARDALTILFWIGSRSQQAFPTTSLAPAVLQDSTEHGEGAPTPMLSIRDLPVKAVQEHIDATNHHLPEDRHIAISLVNSARNFVVTGPPISLYGLNLRLRKVKAPTGLDQTRIPFTKRKIRFVNRFLPITAPFHSSYLADAHTHAVEDLKGINIRGQDLKIAVYDTHTGENMQKLGREDVVPALVRMITRDTVNWEQATLFPKATHVLDFGPGGISGLGVLTNRNKDGTGVRVILAGAMDGTNAEIGYKPELLDRDVDAVKYAKDWVKEHSPKLVRDSVGKTFVDTKMSRLLGVPPVMVAGMTPCTVPWDFVAATMKAGYQIELAGGGYYNAKSMTAAITKIEAAIPPGRGITVNLIYVNPRAMQWQIPLIQQLRADGVPIEGMTIGAGVPSIEVANEYIETLGIKHIAFKPGSQDAIQQVINIARANPLFPVLLQWTGGRGGGHHSYEDFHQPVLQMYSRIRRCANIVLVAGSGFGGAEDTYPYLTGTWTARFGYPPMPFDGCLFGSRMMTAKEAYTSKNAKKAITEAPGVDDLEWERTYKGPTGGVMTVLSEMGEPIHKLATRGVRFWAEMDQRIFSLDKAKRVPELKKQRAYIIRRLNADFQKVWFGRNAAGEVVDLEDMTYAEVVRRMVELMYVRHEARWIDPSLARLTSDFVHRVEERFTSGKARPSILQSTADLDQPDEVVERLVKAFPECAEQIINAQDVQHFLLLCQRRGQKPVPFVPVLDENFEFFFKKDSLWQSEDLEAVVDQDVGRTCILQGPTAVRYSTKVDEPIQEILDGIHEAHIASLVKDFYGGDRAAIPTVEYFGGRMLPEATNDAAPAGVVAEAQPGKTTFRLDDARTLPLLEAWMAVLGGAEHSWRYALFTTEVFVQGKKFQTNPMRRIFAPVRGMAVEVKHTPSGPEVTLSEPSGGRMVETVKIWREPRSNTVTVSLIEHRTATGRRAALPLRFRYVPAAGYAPIQEIMEGRNERIKRFYYQVWFGDEPCPLDEPASAVFQGGQTTITSQAIADFVHAVGNTSEAFAERAGKRLYAPMDFAIVVGWKAILKPIFPRVIDGDLLRLVHLSNGFRMIPGEEPLRQGDVVETSAQINAVINQDAGKMVEVCGTITRAGRPVMEVTSQFLYRGAYDDFENTFQRKAETPMQVHLGAARDVAVLRSKDWFKAESDMALLHQTLTFRCQTIVRFKDRTTYSSVETIGQVLLELPTKEVVPVASVDYLESMSRGNPVVDYLRRHGTAIEQPVPFEHPIPLSGATPLRLRAPASNETYARVSGDYNPIHVARAFAGYAGLPGTITHGMYSSAAVRGLVETWAAENKVGRVRSFHCSLVGMVLPGDDLQVTLRHTAMVAGRKIVTVEAANRETEEKVLVGEAEVEQPVSAYVFTGQGSQEQGMGMDLYDSSSVAKEVWDRADAHFIENYGMLNDSRRDLCVVC